MTVNRIYLCIIILFFAFSAPVIYGQDLKNEKEFRIAHSEAPMLAQKIVDNFKVIKKIKWYKQTNFKQVSFEAKFKKKKCFYSVLFDTSGSIIDIEKTVKWKNLEESAKNNIEEILNKEFEKFKIIKCQIQYTADQFDLENFFENESQSVRKKVNYEVEVEGKVENWLKYEFLIDYNGKILRKREIVDISTDNLNY